MTLANDIELELNGKSGYKLVPTLKAAMAISSQFNGFIGAYQAVTQLELNIVCFIIRTGTDGRGPDGRKMNTDELHEQVWRTGIANLTGVLAKYIKLLETGGKEVSDDEPPKSDEGDTGNA